MLTAKYCADRLNGPDESDNLVEEIPKFFESPVISTIMENHSKGPLGRLGASRPSPSGKGLDTKSSGSKPI